MGTDQTWGADDSERLARAFLDSLLAADTAGIRATLAEDAELVLPRPSFSASAISGADNLATALAGLSARYVDASADYASLLAGPDSVAVEWRLTARLASSGADYEQFYCWVIDVAHGRITEVREYIDTLYGQQLSDATSTSVLDEHAAEAGV